MIHLSDELLESALAEIRQEELNNLPSDEELKAIPHRKVGAILPEVI